MEMNNSKNRLETNNTISVPTKERRRVAIIIRVDWMTEDIPKLSLESKVNEQDIATTEK